MDLGFLSKSSGVTPLLVQLYDNHKLYMLAQDRSPEARGELTNAVSMLLQAELSPRESELVADILIALIRQTERDLRQALSEKLSLIDHVPFRVILHLANEEIDVAAPVLRNSHVLTDMDLIYIIKSRGHETWPYIAGREKMSDNLIDILASTKDFETALTLAQNRSIKLTETALHVLSDMAQGKDVLADTLVLRQEIPQEIARKLYYYVSLEVKKQVCERHKIDPATLDQAMDEVSIEFAQEQPKDEYRPSQAAMKMAERMKEENELNAPHMLSTLKQGHISAFIAQMSVFSNIPSNNIIAMLEQPTGQSLAIVCKAMHVMKGDFISFYLLTNRLRNKGGLADIQDITKAVSYFDRVPFETAKQLIENFRKNIRA